MSKFKIGVVTFNKNIAMCSCSTVLLMDSKAWKESGNSSPKCEKCSNTNFIRISRGARELYPYIEILDKSRKGFKAKRTNLSLSFDDDFNVKIKENMVQILIYNLVNQNMKLFKNGKDMNLKSYDYEGGTIGFFSSINHSDFRKMVSTEETKELYDFAWNTLGAKPRSPSRRFNRALSNLLKYPYMQILANAGFPNVERFFESRASTSRWSTPSYTINPEGTTPKDILGLPKFVLKHLREDDSINLYEIKQIKKALKKVDPNSFRELMDIVKDESNISNLCQTLDIFSQLTNEFGYSNLKRLALYLFREVRMNQGIPTPQNGAILLRDYVRMSVNLEQEYDRYPKSLKKEHDITQMNYKVTLNATKKLAFTNAVMSESYKEFEYKKKEFSIITPSEMQDLVKEGSDLSHCVASYVDSIIDRRCKIFFLRRTSSLEESLATVEVRGENVRQAKGYANRSLRKEEKDFIAEWAKKKELLLNYY